MRTPWRWARVCGRVLPVAGPFYLLFVLFLPTTALAQSGVGRAINTATGLSLADAVDKNLNDMMGAQGAGAGAGSAAGGGGFTIIPTGRLRGSDHDILKTDAHEGNFAWDTREVSAFANGVYAAPGAVMGGQLKFGIFGGYNEVTLKLKNGGDDTLSIVDNQYGSALNDSAIFGASVLWASPKGMYVLGTVVGFVGETKLNDAIDFCNDPPPLGPGGCPMRHYRFDTSGFIGTLTAGNVIPLSKSATGPLLDIRGAASYTQNTGDTFVNFEGDTQKYKFSTWTLTGSTTLFANISLPNSALLRPYVQGYVRQELDYDNHLLSQKVGDPFVITRYDQAHTYAGVDAGLTYAQGKMTLGAAIYYDASADDRTLGGRVGASWKLN